MRLTSFLLLHALLFLLSSPAALLAQGKPAPDSEIEKMRKDIDALKRRVEELDRKQPLQPHRSPTGTPWSGSAGAVRQFLEGRVQWGGYFDLEFRDEQRDQSEFDHHRLILLFRFKIADWIFFDSEIEWEGGGAGAGFLTGNEIVVEFAQLHFAFHQLFNMKVGALLMPWGEFNVLHDSPLRDLTDRPFVVTRVVPSTYTDAGVAFYGGTTIDDHHSVRYELAITNGLHEGFTANNGSRNARSSFRDDNNNSKQVTLRLDLLQQDLFKKLSVNLGLSGAISEYDNEDRNQMTYSGADTSIRFGPFSGIGKHDAVKVKVEYAHINLERDDIQRQVNATPPRLYGYYAQFSYHFFPESWRKGNIFGSESSIALVYRYDENDLDTSRRGGGVRDDRNAHTIGLAIRPIDKTVFKIEYKWVNEKNGRAEEDNDRVVVSVATYF